MCTWMEKNSENTLFCVIFVIFCEKSLRNVKFIIDFFVKEIYSTTMTK